MANREENLKKINENLELLSDEQLEQVAGGFDVEKFKQKVDTAKLGEIISKLMNLINDIKP